MLNLGPIDTNREIESDKDNLKEIRNYLWQLYTELNYRLDDIDKRIKELKDNEH